MKVKEMLRLADLVVENHKHFDMEHWLIKESCGTTGCMAGLYLANKKGYQVKIPSSVLYSNNLIFFKKDIQIYDPGDEAARLLKLEDSSMFHINNWPDKYREMYDNAKSSKGRARVAYKMIHNVVKEHQKAGYN